MINNDEYEIGSIVKFKKPHPSRTKEWKVIRLGIDIKIQSTIIKSLYIMMPRKKFNRKVIEIVKK